MAKKEEKKEEKIVSPLEQLQTFLKANEGKHYNFEEEPDFVVSSGSLKLDIQMAGGMRPGVLRLTGVTEGGKSSCALSFAKNFQDTVPNSMVIYIRAEGRLSKEIIERSGINTAPDRFFVFKSNCYETVINLIRNQVKNNKSKAHYLFIIDSVDGLVPEKDLDKPPEEANKVAGGTVLTSDFLRKMANAFIAYGHFCILTSQVRSQVKINQYEKTDPRVTNASGGNAMLHYSDWIIEFQYRYHGDLITSLPEGKGDILGHNCKVVFRKSPNEKTYVKVDYPIKYGRKNGQSIWIEREISDILLTFGMFVKSGSWFNPTESLNKELKENNLPEIEKIQGEENIVEYLESNPETTKYLYKKFKELLKK